jgi:hypothetical protein
MSTFILCSLTVLMFLLTLGTITHVIVIDLKYAKEKYRKAQIVNCVIWMTIVGVAINVPMIVLCVRTLSKS